MNEKVNIQDFINFLVEKHGISSEDADLFIKEFIRLIEEGLEKDKYVKVKGLGTFKLIAVESRESIHVNTGERIEIQGHTKVSFTPDNGLKELVNRPFAHFESVVLNDHVTFDDMQTEEDESAETLNSDVTENESANSNILSAIKDVSKIDDVSVINCESAESENFSDVNEKSAALKESVNLDTSSEKEDEPTIEKNTILKKLEEEEVKPAHIPGIKGEEDLSELTEQPILAEQPQSESHSQSVISDVDSHMDSVTTSSRKGFSFIGMVALVMTVCTAVILAIYWDSIFITEKKLVLEEHRQEYVEPQDSARIVSVKADSLEIIKEDTVFSKEAEKIQIEPKADNVKKKVEMVENKKNVKPAVAAKPFTPDSVGYMIVGTQTTYTMKEGETLTKVALRFYGTKALWPYIVKHNAKVIKNPDNVPYGTIIEIPKLKKKL